MESKEGFLANKMEGIQRMPSPENWEKISGTLDNERRKKRAFYWWFTGLAAVFTGVWFGFLWNSNDFSEQNLSNNPIENGFLKHHFAGEQFNNNAQIVSDEKDSLMIDLINWDCLQYFPMDGNWNFGSGYWLPGCAGNIYYDDYNHHYVMPTIFFPENIDHMPMGEIVKIPQTLPDLNVRPDSPNNKFGWYKEVMIGAYFNSSITTKSNYESALVTNDTTTTAFDLSEAPAQTNNYRYYKPIEVKLMLGKSLSKRWDVRAGIGGNLMVQEWTENGSKKQNFAVSAIVPISMRYQMHLKTRHRFFIESGVYGEVPLFQKKTPDVAVSESAQNNPFGYRVGASLSLGYHWYITEKYALSIQPEVRYGFMQQQSNLPKLWSGINVNFRF